jgi:hypothetical protein
MEDKRDHRVRIVAALFLAVASVLLPAGIARAEEDPFDWDTTITVGTDDDGVNVDAGNEGEAPGAGGGGGSGTSSGPRCWLEELTGDEIDESIQLEYWARRMRYAPYYLYCDGERQGIIWIEIILDSNGNPVPIPTTPREVAERLRDQMPVPRATIGINPDRGVVGVESWFWIDGYDGSLIADSTDAFGYLVEIQARVSRYRWSFGDGTSVEGTSPGRAYPERSQVRHTYERSSAGILAGYPVEATFTFQVRYRVDGGPWIALPGISRTANALYPVRESQAVIQR